jgi:hypothetical protein
VAHLSAALLAVALLAAGCAGPAAEDASYRSLAATSVQAAASQVATAQTVVTLLVDGDTWTPYADQTVSGAETALGSISSDFGSAQPPPGSDRVRTRVSTLLTDAEDAAASARIAVRRGDTAGLQSAEQDLRRVSAQLAAAEQDLS